MKKSLYILLFILQTLPVREGLGVGYYAHAISFEVQVPMSSQPQQTTVLMHQPLTSGRFQTSVNPLNENGRAYSPGQQPQTNAVRGPRRVSHDDDEDDPYMGNVVPLGDTPWLIILLLSLGYIAFRLFRKKRVE